VTTAEQGTDWTVRESAKHRGISASTWQDFKYTRLLPRGCHTI